MKMKMIFIRSLNFFFSAIVAIIWKPGFNESMNPITGSISRFLWCAMIRGVSDHWSWSGSSQRNARQCRSCDTTQGTNSPGSLIGKKHLQAEAVYWEIRLIDKQRADRCCRCIVYSFFHVWIQTDLYATFCIVCSHLTWIIPLPRYKRHSLFTGPTSYSGHWVWGMSVYWGY